MNLMGSRQKLRLREQILVLSPRAQRKKANSRKRFKCKEQAPRSVFETTNYCHPSLQTLLLSIIDLLTSVSYLYACMHIFVII